MRRPRAPHAVSMTWRDGLFVHWPVAPEELRPRVPAPLELDIRDGRAWISVLPFVLARAGFRYSPGVARLTFPEVNVRTYVRFDGEPGLYFFDIDVGHSIAPLVRTATGLPVHYADADVSAEGDRVSFRSVRSGPPDEVLPARLDVTYRPDGEVFRPEPGSLDHWLVERRRMYAPEGRGRGVLYGEIAHDPWPLQPAEVTIDENTVFEGGNLPVPDDEPRVRFAADRFMTGSLLRPIRGT